MPSQDRQRAALARNAENASRLAFADFRFQVLDGEGLVEFDEPGQFGLTFIREPIFSTGVVINLDDLADAFGLAEGVNPETPQVTPFVTAWDQDDRDFYVGAWCGCTVTWGLSGPPLDFTFQIDFSFIGIGIKDVEPEVRQ